jgi:hypothetical protein
MISMNREVGDNPAAASARAAVHRSFTKPNKVAFTWALINSIKEIPVHSPGGLYLGHVASYDVDLNRLCNVIERTMRGLYFHEFKCRLADETKCVTYSLDGFVTADIENSASVQRLWQLALSGQKRMFGNNVFAYWFQSLDAASATLWAFVVYGCSGFIVITRPKIERAKNLLSKEGKDADGCL